MSGERRQYLLRHADGRVHVFTGIPEVHTDESGDVITYSVEISDIEDYRTLRPVDPDAVHDHCYGGDE